LSVVKTLFLVAALVYVGVKTAEAVQGVRTNALVFHLSPSWLLASAAFVLSAYALLIWTWLYVVRALSGRSMPYLIAARIWFISNLGKYIPGKIWQIVQMGLMSTEQGIDPVSSTAAAIVNAGVNVAMGLAVGVVAGAPLFDRLLEPYGVAWLSRVVAVLALICVVLLPFMLPWAFRTGHRKFGIGAPIEAAPTRAIVVSAIANIVAWFLYGAAFQCLIHGLLGSTNGSLIEYTAAFAISYVLGYLMVLAPGGLGVREIALVQVLIAGGMATNIEASAISVSSRLWLVVIEVLPALLFLAYRPRRTDDKGPTRV
jgi:hypothetical protein